MSAQLAYRAVRVARRLAIPLAFAVLAIPLGGCARQQTEPLPLSVGQPFRAAVELHELRRLAVQDDGRVKTFDALARDTLHRAFGPEAIAAADPVLTYLDLMLVPGSLGSAPVLHAPKAAFRQRLVQAIREARAARGGTTAAATDEEFEASLDRFATTGRCAPAWLDRPDVREALATIDRDLMGGSKEVQRLLSARQLADARSLAQRLRVIPPPGGTDGDRWFPLSAAAGGSVAADDPHHGVLGLGLPEQFDATLRAGLAADFEQLRRGWQFQDVAATNDAIQALVTALPAIEPALYPSATRRQIESFYLRAGKLTWGWLFYLAALVPLLLGFTRGSDRALRLGWTLFAAALVVHTAAIGLRWYIAGRIPNANMFEAICASSWFGAVVALVIERAIRRSGKRGLPTLAGAVTGMTALMAGHFLPVSLSSEIAPVMPILDRTVWLYIHTNLVIASYALIFCGAVTAVLYLLRRLAHAGGESLTLLDGTTMIFLQLAFVTLWVGTVLGAVWADVSWGRPWGWDPKEVFALNTWLVFLMLLHVRLRTRDKGLWTAWLAVIGCAVMLFNWIAVNFVIVGLHSYA